MASVYDPSDVTATEVLNNIEAMRWAVESLGTAEAITVDDLIAIHERLLTGTSLEEYRGPGPDPAELDRGQLLQPMLGRVRSTAGASTSGSCWRISASSATTTRCRRSRRPLWRMHNSRRSIRSSTGMGGPVER